MLWLAPSMSFAFGVNCRNHSNTIKKFVDNASLVKKVAIVGTDDREFLYRDVIKGKINSEDWLDQAIPLLKNRFGAVGGIICDGAKHAIASATLTEDCQYITLKSSVLFDKNGKMRKNCQFARISPIPNADGKLAEERIDIDYDLSKVYQKKSCVGKDDGLLGVALKSCAKGVKPAIMNAERYATPGALTFQEAEIVSYIQQDDQWDSGKYRKQSHRAKGEIITKDSDSSACGSTQVIHHLDTAPGSSGSGLLRGTDDPYEQAEIIAVHTGGEGKTETGESANGGLSVDPVTGEGNRGNHNYATLITVEDQEAIRRIIKRVREEREKKDPPRTVQAIPETPKVQEI